MKAHKKILFLMALMKINSLMKNMQLMIHNLSNIPDLKFKMMMILNKKIKNNSKRKKQKK